MFFLQTPAAWFSNIEPVDRKIFFFVNNNLSNSFFDNTMPYIREANLWLPLYLFFFVWALLNFGKRGWLWILFAACTGALTDLVSSRLIKENIFRLRPCQNPELMQKIHVLVNYCPGSSSFTSSHAANHFGFAAFLVITLSRFTPAWIYLLYVWAAAICFAQVYVGVHYPFDVVTGGILGWLLGAIMARFFNNYAGLISLQHKTA
jgi:undecaprenyl-diphosphatase